MATLRQIAANQANAAKSTGPKSEEGKRASRANALKHGLAGEGVVLPDEHREAIAERSAQWQSSVRPFDAAEVWLLEVMASESIRAERCRDHEADALARRARRAGESWADDRRLAAEQLAAGLPRRPEVVARQLPLTTQGVDVLIERWEGLGRVLDARGDWSDAQYTQALDLLGVPLGLRDAPTPLDPPDDTGPSDWLGRLVADQVAGLRARKPALDEEDGRAQAAAMLGRGPDDAELSRLRRYESVCLRRVRWAFDLIQRRHGSARPSTPSTPFPGSYVSRPAYPPSPPDPSAPPAVGPGHRLSDAAAPVSPPASAPRRPSRPRPKRPPAPRPPAPTAADRRRLALAEARL